MATPGAAFTPTKPRAKSTTPYQYSWVKGSAAMRRSPGLLRTPPERVRARAPPPPPSTGAATAATLNTVGCEYSFVPEKPELGQKDEERPAWDSTLKDPSIYRLPPQEMARRKARLQSPNNAFHRKAAEEEGQAGKGKPKPKCKKAASTKAAFAASAPANPFLDHHHAPASPLRGGAGGRRRLAASLAAVSDDEGLTSSSSRRRREQQDQEKQQQRRLLSASFSSDMGVRGGRSQSVPRGARLSASAAAAAPLSLSQSFAAAKGAVTAAAGAAASKKTTATTKTKPAKGIKGGKQRSASASTSLLGVVDLEEELAAFERRLRRAREDFDLPVAAALAPAAGEDGGFEQEEEEKEEEEKQGAKTMKGKGNGKGKTTAAATIKPTRPRSAPSAPAAFVDHDGGEEEEEMSEDLLHPFSASAPAAAFMPPRLQARLAQSATAAATRRRLAASMDSLPVVQANKTKAVKQQPPPKPPVMGDSRKPAPGAAVACLDAKQDVGARDKSVEAPVVPPSAAAQKAKATSAAPAAAVVGAGGSAEEALLAAVLELDEQWEQGSGPESPLLANKAEAVALGRVLEQWRLHQQQHQQEKDQAHPATAAADMLLRLCARLLRRVGGLQQRNLGLEQRVSRLEVQVGAFAVQLSAVRGGGPPLRGEGQQRRQQQPSQQRGGAVPVPSLHASRVAFEEGAGAFDADEEELLRPLKKRLDDLNASLLATSGSVEAAHRASAVGVSNSKSGSSGVAVPRPSYHAAGAAAAAVDTGLAAEEERQRMMEMMQDMFRQSAGSTGGAAPGGKRLGQAKGPLVVHQNKASSQQGRKPPRSVMELGAWRRPGAWAARGRAGNGKQAQAPN